MDSLLQFVKEYYYAFPGAAWVKGMAAGCIITQLSDLQRKKETSEVLRVRIRKNHSAPAAFNERLVLPKNPHRDSSALPPQAAHWALGCFRGSRGVGGIGRDLGRDSEGKLRGKWSKEGTQQAAIREPRTELPRG